MRKFGLIAVLVSVLLVSGCIGGGGKPGSSFSASEIHAFFDVYAYRIETKATSKLADMYSLPLKLTSASSSAEVTLNSRTDLIDWLDARTYETLGWAIEDVRLIVETVNRSGSTATAKIVLLIDTDSGAPYHFKWRDTIELEATLRKSDGEWKITQERIIRADFEAR